MLRKRNPRKKLLKTPRKQEKPQKKQPNLLNKNVLLMKQLKRNEYLQKKQRKRPDRSYLLNKRKPGKKQRKELRKRDLQRLLLRRRL